MESTFREIGGQLRKCLCIFIDYSQCNTIFLFKRRNKSPLYHNKITKFVTVHVLYLSGSFFLNKSAFNEQKNGILLNLSNSDVTLNTNPKGIIIKLFAGVHFQLFSQNQHPCSVLQYFVTSTNYL